MIPSSYSWQQYSIAIGVVAALFGVAFEGRTAEESDENDDGGSPSVSLEEEVDPQPKEEEENRFILRGSAVSYTNSASAISFNKDAESTYNPMWLMSFGIAPKFWTGKKGYLFLDLNISREITNSDWTTKEGETILDDVVFGAGLAKIYTIPIIKIDISTKLSFVVPTSKASQARTLILGIRPGFSLSRGFDVLSGLKLAYGLSATKGFHYATTAQLEDGVIEDIKASAVVSTRSMASYLNTGVRNASWDLVNTLGVGLDFTDWIGMGLNVGVAHAFLYPLSDDYESTFNEGAELSFSNEDPSDVRYAMIYGAEIHTMPHSAFTITLGASTSNPMLAKDSTYETPFVNRYTAVFLDLRLNIDGLVSVLTSSEE